MLQCLYVFSFHQTYHAEDHGVCYKNAVFGWLKGNDGYKLTVEANQQIYKGKTNRSNGAMDKC